MNHCLKMLVFGDPVSICQKGSIAYSLSLQTALFMQSGDKSKTSHGVAKCLGIHGGIQSTTNGNGIIKSVLNNK
jgi:hypothetical protein